MSENPEIKKKGQSLNINTNLMVQLNKLKKEYTQVCNKLSQYQKDSQEEPSLKEINKELEERCSAISKKLEECQITNIENLMKIKDFTQKMNKREEQIIVDQKTFYTTLQSLKREKEIIKEEEVVDLCRRLINLKETIEKFQQISFPGYMDSLNLIDYVKEQFERFLKIKNVEAIEVNFLNLDREKTIIVNETAKENKILKAGYVLNQKLIYPAEVQISPSYNWILRDYNINEKSEELYQKKVREVVNEVLAVEKEIFLELQKYLLDLEGRHLIILPSFFKDFFRDSFLNLIEKEPEISYIRLNYQRIRNRITEEFRKVLDQVPSFDLVSLERNEIKRKDKQLEQSFNDWQESMSEDITNIKQKNLKYTDVKEVKKNIGIETILKFPWKIRENSSNEKVLESYRYLRRANYFLKTLVNQFKKEISLQFGTQNDLEADFYSIFLKGVLPKDLFVDTSVKAIEELFPYIDQFLGITDEKEFKRSLKDLLLVKGFLTEKNYKEIIKLIINLEFPEDFSKRKSLVINLLKNNFK